jgi:hypothetical protein
MDRVLDARVRDVWSNPMSCTLDPLNLGSNITLSGGDLTATHSATAAWNNVRSTLYKSAGKRYFEVSVTTAGGSNYIMLGIDKNTGSLNTYHGANAGGFGYQSGATKWAAGSSASYGATYTAGDVIGIAVDFALGTITYYKNNSSQGVAHSTVSGSYCPTVSLYTNAVVVARFLRSSFSYAPPTGFSAWTE